MPDKKQIVLSAKIGNNNELTDVKYVIIDSNVIIEQLQNEKTIQLNSSNNDTKGGRPKKTQKLHRKINKKINKSKRHTRAKHNK